MNNLIMEYSIERLPKTFSPIKNVRLFTEAPSGKLRFFVIPIWGHNISGHLPPIYKVSMEEARCGAVFPGGCITSAHTSRRLLSLHLKICLLFALFTTRARAE